MLNDSRIILKSNKEKNMRYEVQIIDLVSGNDQEEAAEQLSEYLNDGWEVIQIVSIAGTSITRAYLKRRIV